VTSVGLIGLGEMGFAMGARLIDQGHGVVGFDPDAARLESAAAIGVQLCASPASVAADSDQVVLCNVRTEAHLDSAWRGPDGALSAIKGRVMVIMSTLGPRAVELAAKEAAAGGGSVVDAPHTGSSPAARSGELIIWLAGSARDLATIHPVMETLASATRVIGDRPGMAQAVKLINAMGLAINLSAVTEMRAVAELNGVDGDLALRAIAGGSGSSWVTSAMPGVAGYLTAHHISNLRKDLRAAVDEATQAGYPMPVTSASMKTIGLSWPRKAEAS
jgi:3-hydroxyisobutyrate dehydrogenase-like beta-hydroxyacid dehydrogenase